MANDREDAGKAAMDEVVKSVKKEFVDIMLKRFPEMTGTINTTLRWADDFVHPENVLDNRTETSEGVRRMGDAVKEIAATFLSRSGIKSDAELPKDHPDVTKIEEAKPDATALARLGEVAKWMEKYATKNKTPTAQDLFEMVKYATSKAVYDHYEKESRVEGVELPTLPESIHQDTPPADRHPGRGSQR